MPKASAVAETAPARQVRPRQGATMRQVCLCRNGFLRTGLDRQRNGKDGGLAHPARSIYCPKAARRKTGGASYLASPPVFHFFAGIPAVNFRLIPHFSRLFPRKRKWGCCRRRGGLRGANRSFVTDKVKVCDGKCYGSGLRKHLIDKVCDGVTAENPGGTSSSGRRNMPAVASQFQANSR
jgi:hypothetical protein